MDNKLYGLTKGTGMEKLVHAVVTAELNGTKMYYTLARMAREQGLPEELAATLEKMADQESNHSGFYAMLNAELNDDVFAVLEQAQKAEFNAKNGLQPLVDWFRQQGHEDAAKQVEEFARQETHHGEMIEELFRKFRK